MTDLPAAIAMPVLLPRVVISEAGPKAVCGPDSAKIGKPELERLLAGLGIAIATDDPEIAVMALGHRYHLPRPYALAMTREIADALLFFHQREAT